MRQGLLRGSAYSRCSTRSRHGKTEKHWGSPVFFDFFSAVFFSSL